MGLSALSALFRRRKLITGPPPARNLRRKDSQPRKPRLTNLTAPELVDTLADMDTVATVDYVNIVTAYITTEPAMLAALVRIATGDADTSADKPNPPRIRLRRSWVAATLLRAGPLVLRERLAGRPELIRLLVSVFACEPGRLDAALATNVCLLLRALLHDCPKETATTIVRANLVVRLVAHVQLQPCADLLPRLVATRVYDPLAVAAVLPAHKRAVAALGAAQVQTVLAERFAAAADKLPSAVGDDRAELTTVLAACCSTMEEISARAMCLPRKHEDHDERSDVIYAGNLSLVTAAVYNDARDHMELLREPAPLEHLLKVAIGAAEESDVLLPALQLVARLLAELRAAKGSQLPSVRTVVSSLDMTRASSLITQLGPALAVILAENGDKVGPRRLAVIDVVREVCETLSETSVMEFMTTDGDALLVRVLEMARSYPSHDLLLVRIAQIMEAILTRCKELSDDILVRSSVLDFLMEMREQPSFDGPISLLARYMDRGEIATNAPAQREKLLEVLQYVRQHQETVPRSALLGRKLAPTRASSDSYGDFTVSGELAATEDYGEELYLHSLLDDLSHGKHGAPPIDSYVAITAAEVENKGNFRALSKRWRTMAH